MRELRDLIVAGICTVVAVVLLILAIAQNRTIKHYQAIESWYDYDIWQLARDYRAMEACLEKTKYNWCECLKELPRFERAQWMEGCAEISGDTLLIGDHTRIKIFNNLKRYNENDNN